jgi:hypothetical protein
LSWKCFIGAELGDRSRSITLRGAARDVEGLAVDENAFVVAEFADHVLRLLSKRRLAEPGEETDGRNARGQHARFI